MISNSAKPGTRKWDEEFEQYKCAHPGATFAQYYVHLALEMVKTGQAHSSLGQKIQDKKPSGIGERDFLEAGRKPFTRHRKDFGIEPHHKLVDYGCGSLRLGVHFIGYLETGHYMGLDVTRDFIEMGNEAARELIAQKQPLLAAIDKASVAKATAFQADFVLSNAVSYHVHPDEIADYFGVLSEICAKPGATLIFDVKLADAPLRFLKRGWAWPLEYYVDHLKPLEFRKLHRLSSVMDERALAGAMQSAVLEFRRL